MSASGIFEMLLPTAWCEEGERLWFCDDSNTLRCFDRQGAECVSSISLPELSAWGFDQMRCMGEDLLVGSTQSDAVLLPLSTLAQMRVVPMGSLRRWASLRDGSLWTWGGKIARRWQPHENLEELKSDAPISAIERVIGDALCIFTTQGLCLIDAHTFKTLSTLSEPKGVVLTASSADGAVVAAATLDKRLMLLRIGRGAPVIMPTNARATHLSMDASGRKIFTSGGGHLLCAFDLGPARDPEEVRVRFLDHHQAPVKQISANASGTVVASCDQSGNAYWLNTQSEEAHLIVGCASISWVHAGEGGVWGLSNGTIVWHPTIV